MNSDWKRVRFTPKAQGIMFLIIGLGFGLGIVHMNDIGYLIIFATTGLTLVIATVITFKPIGWHGLSKDFLYDSNWRNKK